MIVSRSDRERFDEKWDLDPETGCWIWNAGRDKNGYGRFVLGDRTRSAPRAAWMIYRGDPGSLFILHSCDTPSCVNPFDCLFLGTQADNVRDMDQKGRRVATTRVAHRGSERPGAKLDEEVVRAIRASTERGCDLAERYGVTRTLISGIRHGKLWRHVA